MIKRFCTLFFILLTVCNVFCADNSPLTEPIELQKYYPQDSVLSTTRQNLYRISYLPRNAGELNLVVKNIDAARRNVARAVADAFIMRIDIVLLPDTKAMTTIVGNTMEHNVAVVRSDTKQVFINCDMIKVQNPDTVLRILTHEMTHLYLAIRLKAPIPRWLNEGIAMRVARDWTPHYHSIIAWAIILKRNIPLSQLEYTFPADSSRQQLAYAESYAVTDFIIQKQYAGSLPMFLSSLTGTSGINRAQSFFLADYRDSIESAWLISNAGFKAWSVAFLNENMSWLLLLLLCFCAWIVIFYRRRQQRKLWALETQMEQMRLDFEQRTHVPTNEEIEAEILRDMGHARQKYPAILPRVPQQNIPQTPPPPPAADIQPPTDNDNNGDCSI